MTEPNAPAPPVAPAPAAVPPAPKPPTPPVPPPPTPPPAPTKAESTSDELLSMSAEISAIASSIPTPGVTDSYENSKKLHAISARLKEIVGGK